MEQGILVAEKVRGKVINFLERKGYGFIETSDGQKLFVHYSDIKGADFKTLTTNEEVEFDIVSKSKRLQAINVKRINPPPPDEEVKFISKKTW